MPRCHKSTSALNNCMFRIFLQMSSDGETTCAWDAAHMKPVLFNPTCAKQRNKDVKRCEEQATRINACPLVLSRFETWSAERPASHEAAQRLKLMRALTGQRLTGRRLTGRPHLSATKTSKRRLTGWRLTGGRLTGWKLTGWRVTGWRSGAATFVGDLALVSFFLRQLAF